MANNILYLYSLQDKSKLMLAKHFGGYYDFRCSSEDIQNFINAHRWDEKGIVLTECYDDEGVTSGYLDNDDNLEVKTQNMAEYKIALTAIAEKTIEWVGKHITNRDYGGNYKNLKKESNND